MEEFPSLLGEILSPLTFLKSFSTFFIFFSVIGLLAFSPAASESLRIMNPVPEQLPKYILLLYTYKRGDFIRCIYNVSICWAATMSKALFNGGSQ